MGCSVLGAAAALSGHEGVGGYGSAGCDASSRSDNEHVVWEGVWQGPVVGGAWCPPRPTLEEMSLALAEVPFLQG